MRDAYTQYRLLRHNEHLAREANARAQEAREVLAEVTGHGPVGSGYSCTCGFYRQERMVVGTHILNEWEKAAAK